MKTFARQCFERLGGTVTDTAKDTLLVRTSRNTAAFRVLADHFEQEVSFSPEKTEKGMELMVSGSRMMDRLHEEINARGTLRHRLLTAEQDFYKKTVNERWQVFQGTVEKLKMQKQWHTSIKCYLLLKLVSDELLEELLVIDVPPFGSARLTRADGCSSTSARWVERPPIRKYQLVEQLEKGVVLAEALAVEKAEDCRRESIERLYRTLSRLRCYYQQLKEESSEKDDERDTYAIEAEYQRRKTEEVAKTSVRAELKIIAVETISRPVKVVTWRLSNNNHEKTVQLILSMTDGSEIAPVTCEICQRRTDSFGLSSAGSIVCSECIGTCGICSAEITGSHAVAKTCHDCSIQICDNHRHFCTTCHEFFCEDHIAECSGGCTACTNCMVHCIECGRGTAWCPEHTIKNIRGDIICRQHAIYCALCREPFPSFRIDTCRICGQTVCESCYTRCDDCGEIICTNHIEKGRCVKCREGQRKERNNYQMKLFMKQRG